MRRGTVVLKQPLEPRNKHQSVEAIEEFGFDAYIGGARRDEEKARQGTHFLVPRLIQPMGPKESAPRIVGSLQRVRLQGREHPRLSDLQLDRIRRMAIHRAGKARTDVDLLRAHPPVVRKNGGLLPVTGITPAKPSTKWISSATRGKHSMESPTISRLRG